MTRPFDVVVLGGASIDHAVRGPALPSPGTSVEGESFHQGPGGKGANAAVAAARLGARVALVARLGADAEGDAILARLRSEGVDVQAVSRDEGEPTGATVVHVDHEGGKQTMARGGANRRATPAEVRRALASLSEDGRPSLLLVQLELPLAAVEEAIRSASGRGWPVVLDPAPARELPESLFDGLEAVTPNRAEAKAATGMEIEDEASAHRAAHRLLEMGARIAAVDAGSAGKAVAWRGGSVQLPRLPVEVVDTTGAGDAFAAALAVRLAEGAPPGEAARFAHAASALATTALGAQSSLPSQRQVREQLEGGL